MIPAIVSRSVVRRAALVAFVFAAACQSKPATPPVPSAASSAPSATPASGTRQPVFSHALSALDGSRLTATVVEVRYGPGESSKPHSHPCDVIGYILEGTYRTQVRGGPEAVYTAGQSFYEAANGAHVVSANASAEKPVRFLAYFTCDRQTPLTVPVPDSGRSH